MSFSKKEIAEEMIHLIENAMINTNNNRMCFNGLRFSREEYNRKKKATMQYLREIKKCLKLYCGGIRDA